MVDAEKNHYEAELRVWIGIYSLNRFDEDKHCVFWKAVIKCDDEEIKIIESHQELPVSRSPKSDARRIRKCKKRLKYDTKAYIKEHKRGLQLLTTNEDGASVEILTMDL